jgi:uncharacterized protein YjbI with pentapeptide repeats
MTSQPNATANLTSLTAAQLLERYASGEKKIGRVQLKKADLKGANLAQIDLRGADLSGANLREADLSNANLKEACLDGADLYKANLTRTNFQGARLEKTNLKEANLTRASLENAVMTGAFLTKALMSRANLTETQLVGAHLNEADLSYANISNAYLDNAYLIETNLQRATLEQTSLMGSLLSGAVLNGASFKGSYYTDKTNFDASFDPIGAGLHEVQPITMAEILSVFRDLSKCATRYVGPKMTAKYWESSRPNCQWLQQFEIGSSGQITFAGTMEEALTYVEIKPCYKWIDKFISSCAAFIPGFLNLVDLGKLKAFIGDESQSQSLEEEDDALF